MGRQEIEWLTIVETASFIRHAEKVFQLEELNDLKQTLANTPKLGDIIRHSGGIRKIRVATQQKGKSGGARVIYYYHNAKIPLFLLDVYTKSEKVDLRKDELTILRNLTEQLRKAYGG